MHYIDQQWLKGNGPIFSSYNPATGEAVWQGAAADEYEVNLAVNAARYAFDTWSNLSIEKRIEYLHAFGEALKAMREDLVEAISKETGKPLWESQNEWQSMINKIEISIEAYHKRCSELIHQHPTSLSITRHKPHGVVAVFGPFNFPGHLPNGHIIPALLAGNTIIFKPSEFTPLVAEITLQCWEKAKLPSGVINLLQGDKKTGKLLASHPDIDGLFFTGSWETGKILSEQFASFPQKILALEMGGNNPLIFDEVSDIKAAVYLTIQSAYLSSGQRCTCARRLIIPRGTNGDHFLESLIPAIKKIRVGIYTEKPEPFMGPVIHQSAVKHLLETQNTLQAMGGKELIPMTLLKSGTALLSPGLMDTTDIVDKPDQEIFGPFLQVIRVLDFEEAIKEANRTSYGLAAGLMSDNEQSYREFYQKIRAGIVNWNTQLTGASSAAPFGGIGRSGNHRPSAYYAADYCSFPVASLETTEMILPQHLSPGLEGL